MEIVGHIKFLGTLPNYTWHQVTKGSVLLQKRGARRREPKTFFKAFPDFLFSFTTIKKKDFYYILTYGKNISQAAINDIAFLAVDWEYAVRKTQKLQS